MKKTLVLGASPKPERYAYKAVKLLGSYGHPVVAVGLREATIGDIAIVKPDAVSDTDIHTITLYVGPPHQAQYYDYLLALRPKRIIFNPGTENDELAELAQQANIEVVEHCTLVMLNSGIF